MPVNAINKPLRVECRRLEILLCRVIIDLHPWKQPQLVDAAHHTRDHLSLVDKGQRPTGSDVADVWVALLECANRQLHVQLLPNRVDQVAGEEHDAREDVEDEVHVSTHKPC